MPVSPQLDNEADTLEEAAALRLDRNAADTQVRRWRDTGGEGEIPCVEPGRTIRVPRQALLAMLRPDSAAGSPS